MKKQHFCRYSSVTGRYLDLNLFQRVIIHGRSALDHATLTRQPRSYAQSLANRLNCSDVDEAAASTSSPSAAAPRHRQQVDHRRRLMDCLKRTPVADLVAAGAAVSAEAPRFLSAFGPSVDGRAVRDDDPRGRMSHRGGGVDGGGRRSVFANVSLLVGFSVGDELSRLTQTELDAVGSNDVTALNSKRRTLMRTFVQNLLTFHRQTIADILMHQVQPKVIPLFFQILFDRPIFSGDYSRLGLVTQKYPKEELLV